MLRVSWREGVLDNVEGEWVIAADTLTHMYVLWAQLCAWMHGCMGVCGCDRVWVCGCD